MQKWLIEHVGWDKIAHFSLSGWLTFIVFVYMQNIIWSVLVVLVIGVIKELTDSKFDWFDLLADVSGIMISAFILRG